MIDGKNFFNQPMKNNKITYENLLLARKIGIGQGDYTTGFYQIILISKKIIR